MRTFFFFLFSMGFLIVNAQENQSLNQRFKSMLESSRDYNEFEVINAERLNIFWDVVNDSLKAYNASIDDINGTLTNAQSTIDELNDELKNVKESLAEVQAKKDEMSLLGSSFDKGTYSLIIGAIILILFAGVVLLFLAFNNSNKVTKSTKKDYEDLVKEFEEYRKRSLEKQAKLKRELQTAINAMEGQ